MAAGTLTATWLVSVVASPISGWFNRWMPWGALLGVVAAAAVWPGLPENLVREVASIAGVVFAAQVAAMTSLVLELERSRNARASASRASDASLNPGRTLGDLAINLLRFTAVLALAGDAGAAPALHGKSRRSCVGELAPSREQRLSERLETKPR